MHHTMYRLAPAEREIISTQVADMLEQGVISASTSSWSSLVVLIHEKDGTICFCVDYQKLNSTAKQDVHPLP